MGCGKSAVARSLSRQLRVPFIDLDARIERQIGCSIAQFFAQRGEPSFALSKPNIFRRWQFGAALFRWAAACRCAPKTAKCCKKRLTAARWSSICKLRRRFWPGAFAARRANVRSSTAMASFRSKTRRKRVEELLAGREENISGMRQFRGLRPITIRFPTSPATSRTLILHEEKIEP